MVWETEILQRACPWLVARPLQVSCRSVEAFTLTLCKESRQSHGRKGVCVRQLPEEKWNRHVAGWWRIFPESNFPKGAVKSGRIFERKSGMCIWSIFNNWNLSNCNCHMMALLAAGLASPIMALASHTTGVGDRQRCDRVTMAWIRIDCVAMS